MTNKIDDAKLENLSGGNDISSNVNDGGGSSEPGGGVWKGSGDVNSPGNGGHGPASEQEQEQSGPDQSSGVG